MANKLLKLFLTGALIMVVSACQTNTYLPNTYNMEPKSTWSDQQRQIALKSYLYAQMANNAYGQAGDDYDKDGFDFILPSTYSTEHFPNNDIGFAYSIYKKHENGKLIEVVLAFRGTEGFTNWDDFWNGNFLARQNTDAILKYNEIRKILDDNGQEHVPIILVGHSLGGALAIHVAINTKELVPYYVFNSSPRFTIVDKWEAERNPELIFRIRFSIVETSEFLYSLRFPATEVSQTYQPMNCDKNFKPISSHGIEKLAKCLTMIAAINKSDVKIEQKQKMLAR